MKKLKKIYLIMLTALVAYSCSNNDDAPQKTIYESISEDQDISVFVSALDKIPELKDVLNDGENVITSSDSFTVFVPTDEAFNAFLSDNGYADIDDIDTAEELTFLTNYMSNHIIKDKTGSDVMQSEGLGYLTTSGNISLFFDATLDNIVLNGSSAIIESDINASNGIIYIVDQVIEIPTLTTFVEASPDFETMREALVIIEDELGSTVNSDLTNAAQYTIFLPNESAFNNLYEAAAISHISDLDPTLIEDIVEIHIIPNNNMDADDIEDAVGSTINTLTDVLNVDVNGDGDYTLTDPQDGIAVIVKTDIRASNGIIHIIDRVLLGN